MGGLMLHANSAFEEFGCKFCLYSPECEETCIEHEQRTSTNTEQIFKAMPLEDLDIFSTSENVDLTVQELGVALNGILHIHDTRETLHSTLSSNNNDICKQKELQSFSLDTNMLKDMSKHATILCSKLGQSYPLTFEVEEELSSTVVHVENLFKAENPTYVPDTPKLVSAMKGSRRAPQGTPLKTKLSVKWAPDVYDPPVTSESHTVKGRRQRPKDKKDHHKHRHSKGNSSRGSGGDRRHAHRRSTGSSIDSRILRLRAHSDGLLLNGFGQSKVEVNYSVRNQESKFGGSCYMEPLRQVHLSVAEAS